jgi:hypothetical protein
MKIDILTRFHAPLPRDKAKALSRARRIKRKTDKKVGARSESRADTCFGHLLIFCIVLSLCALWVGFFSDKFWDWRDVKRGRLDR